VGADDHSRGALPDLALLALVQHTQNHDSNAIELKLDELIASLEGPSDEMLRVEEASERDLEHLQEHFGERRTSPRR
jgi:low affinity Fe/Cu permease